MTDSTFLNLTLMQYFYDLWLCRPINGIHKVYTKILIGDALFVVVKNICGCGRLERAFFQMLVAVSDSLFGLTFKTWKVSILEYLEYKRVI